MPQTVLDYTFRHCSVAPQTRFVTPRFNVCPYPLAPAHKQPVDDCTRLDIFDDQARKQYAAKLPDHNPFGDGETTTKFADFDIFTKVCLIVKSHMPMTWN